MIDMGLMIDEFLNSFGRYNEDQKNVAEKLLRGRDGYSLINQEEYGNIDLLAENIRDSVLGYTRSKDSAIDIYKKFADFLNSKGYAVKIEFPPIRVSNTFERLMFIAKYLQDENHKIADISDLLWVSQRTVEADIAKLRGYDDDPIQICGKKFEIDDAERRDGTLSFASTAHPLFLTPNITQIIAMLKGLKAMSRNRLYENYAVTAAADIWEQLSDYAKNRILYVFRELMPEDLKWYESLEIKNGCTFRSERICSEGYDVVLDCLKNEKPFFVEYRDDDAVRYYGSCKYVNGSCDQDYIEIICNGEKKKLKFDNILKSSYTAEGLL